MVRAELASDEPTRELVEVSFANTPNTPDVDQACIGA